MILINPRINVLRGDVIGLVGLGDIHAGSPAYDEERTQQVCDWIAPRKNVYVLGIGDYADHVVYTDAKRFNPAGMNTKNMDNLALAQCQYVVKLMRPFRDRILGLLEGNHEYEIARRGHINPMTYICGPVKEGGLNVPYLSYCSVVTLSINRLPKQVQNYQIYAHHGWGGGKNFAAGINNVNQMKNFVNDADLYMMGHVHKQMIAPLDGGMYVSRRDPLNMRERLQYGVLTGSFMNTFASGANTGHITYTEKQGFPPVKKGCPVIWLRVNSNSRREKEKHAPLVSLDGVTFI